MPALRAAIVAAGRPRTAPTIMIEDQLESSLAVASRHGSRRTMRQARPARAAMALARRGRSAGPSGRAWTGLGSKEATMARTVVLVGALDTKGEDFRFIRDLIAGHGLATLVVDFGVMGSPGFTPDVSRDEVVAAAGGDLARMASGDHKDEAMQTMAAGLASVVKRLHDEGHLDGIIGRRQRRHVDRHDRHARAPRRRTESDGLHDAERRASSGSPPSAPSRARSKSSRSSRSRPRSPPDVIRPRGRPRPARPPKAATSAQVAAFSAFRRSRLHVPESGAARPTVVGRTRPSRTPAEPGRAIQRNPNVGSGHCGPAPLKGNAD